MDAKGTATMLGLELATLLTLDSQRRLPSPVLICGQSFWRIAEVRAWVRAGCPPRAKWERLRDRPA